MVSLWEPPLAQPELSANAATITMKAEYLKSLFCNMRSVRRWYGVWLH